MRTAWNKELTKHKPRPCICGCGELIKLHKYPKKDGGFTCSVNKFIKGHSARGINGFNSEIHCPRICECGCGQYTNKYSGKYNRFIRGHENIGRVAWNKGKSFSAESRYKMRLARLGKEPANKISINPDTLFRLYVKEKKNARQVSKEMNVPSSFFGFESFYEGILFSRRV